MGSEYRQLTEHSNTRNQTHQDCRKQFTLGNLAGPCNIPYLHKCIFE